MANKTKLKKSTILPEQLTKEQAAVLIGADKVQKLEEYFQKCRREFTDPYKPCAYYFYIDDNREVMAWVHCDQDGGMGAEHWWEDRLQCWCTT